MWYRRGMSDADPLRGRLRTWIQAHGESARGLSLLAGLSENAVGRYLEGATKRLSLESVIALADAMGASRAVVLGEAGYAPAPEPPQDTAGQIDLLLQEAGVSDAARESLMQHVRLVLGQFDGPTAARAPRPASASPTIRRRS